jgi:hypothetical protein
MNLWNYFTGGKGVMNKRSWDQVYKENRSLMECPTSAVTTAAADAAAADLAVFEVDQ